MNSDKFEKTSKQKEAISLLSSGARHVMLYGGSRSGKTFILCYALIIRALKTPSRHLIARMHFNHIKTSIWMDTLPKVIKLCFPQIKPLIKWNKADFFIQIPSEGGYSEIWIAGLDDDERTEKILGKEYSTIFYNECSQIPYTSTSIALTRLAEKNNLKKIAYYDENPPSKRHWSYSQFILKKHPETWLDLDADKYASMILNPQDNLTNIDSEYITEILGGLSGKDKQRFADGCFGEVDSGVIYYAFKKDEHIQEFKKEGGEPIWMGMDFNMNPATAAIGWIKGNHIYIWDEFFKPTIAGTKEVASYLVKDYMGATIVPDATGKALKSSAAGFTDHDHLIKAGFRIESSINPYRVDRYNAVNDFFDKKQITIHPRCINLIRDLENLYFKDGTNMPDTKDKMLGHISDALGYLVFKVSGKLYRTGNRTTQL